jgi:hypothetical protein
MAGCGPYVEQRLDTCRVLGRLDTCQYVRQVSGNRAVVPSWSLGSLGGSVCYHRAVLRNCYDAASRLGKKVHMDGPKLPPAAKT